MSTWQLAVPSHPELLCKSERQTPHGLGSIGVLNFTHYKTVRSGVFSPVASFCIGIVNFVKRPWTHAAEAGMKKTHMLVAFSLQAFLTCFDRNKAE